MFIFRNGGPESDEEVALKEIDELLKMACENVQNDPQNCQNCPYREHFFFENA